MGDLARASPDLHDTPTECVACQAQRVREFLDLGNTALANEFLADSQLAAPQPTYALRVGFCQSCSHVQLTRLIPPAAMFEDYLYVSSASTTLSSHLRELSDTVVTRYGLSKQDLVIDIGCNDGTLLKGFQHHGVRTLGVDPARNLADLSEGSKIDRVTDFFGADAARRIVKRWGRASAITATNTFPHIPDLDDFLRGIQLALAPGGVFVIEAHYLLDLLEQGAFDTIYHEHVSYWRLGTMTPVFEKHGMQVVNAERLPIHHGQLRVFVQRCQEAAPEPAVAEILDIERQARLDQFQTYQAFAGHVQEIKQQLHTTLGRLRADGRRVVGYGAPAKGNTLLSFLGIGPETIEYIVDRSPLKQGLLTPGTHIPIVPPERLLTDRPDYALLLAWNFVDEILAEQAEYRRGGGKFILPVPETKII